MLRTSPASAVGWASTVRAPWASEGRRTASGSSAGSTRHTRTDAPSAASIKSGNGARHVSARAISQPSSGMPSRNAPDQLSSVMAIASPRRVYVTRSPMYACIDGSYRNLATLASSSATNSAG